MSLSWSYSTTDSDHRILVVILSTNYVTYPWMSLPSETSSTSSKFQRIIHPTTLRILYLWSSWLFFDQRGWQHAGGGHVRRRWGGGLQCPVHFRGVQVRHYSCFWRSHVWLWYWHLRHVYMKHIYVFFHLLPFGFSFACLVSSLLCILSTDLILAFGFHWR